MVGIRGYRFSIQAGYTLTFQGAFHFVAQGVLDQGGRCGTQTLSGGQCAPDCVPAWGQVSPPVPPSTPATTRTSRSMLRG